jgi:hypothetical protein
MPVARSTGQRIRAGVWTPADVTDAYAITALPVQSDQNDSCPWILNAELSKTPTPARVVTQADLSRGADGFTAWQWGFDYMTLAMTNFWNTSFIPGGAWSYPVTVMDYNENNQPVFYTAEIWRVDYPSDKAQYLPGGWGKVIFELKRGVQLFP